MLGQPRRMVSAQQHVQVLNRSTRRPLAPGPHRAAIHTPCSVSTCRFPTGRQKVPTTEKRSATTPGVGGCAWITARRRARIFMDRTPGDACGSSCSSRERFRDRRPMSVSALTRRHRWRGTRAGAQSGRTGLPCTLPRRPAGRGPVSKAGVERFNTASSPREAAWPNTGLCSGCTLACLPWSRGLHPVRCGRPAPASPRHFRCSVLADAGRRPGPARGLAVVQERGFRRLDGHADGDAARHARSRR
jgi:hypothetical protein